MSEIGELDLASLVTRAQSDSLGGVLSDHVFREKLLNLCPWFEPRFSHRNTWRECAEEFVRRRSQDEEFAPELKLVDAKEFNEKPVLDTREKTLVWKELDNGKYTSEHGIEVDLAFLKQREEVISDESYDQTHDQHPNLSTYYSETTSRLPWPSPEEAFDIVHELNGKRNLPLQSKIVSFPDVLVLLLQDFFVRNRSEAIVKYRRFFWTRTGLC